ncbi:hypothetical protein AVI51_10835 [Piscirickettsia salmonis]|uniref:Uncharacterized protein n=2 Tax=Piscirickettsia salmonis TaxID=1238 RepID=A0A9Q5VAF5_PISSA|nr:hypothetical protein [Piscirickettsia salmonis]ALA26495.1 papain cysteine protease family protein [Piscirickettsia salmonis]APS43907.1 hypothetical protein AVI48_05675 [Piscirickettsia salmonis]APS47261.1 hypothetical protein AVI49_06280 [Piscirickettsia salmonis]APS51303.1 hypothetical protein AVI50_10950 [Piscirickettsia salmonis]APS54510.1 hypothetical protein AVI51_10835 [Piscirickettsia salmonis]
MLNKSKLTLISSSLLLSASAFAGAIQIVGTTTTTVPVNSTLVAATNGGKAIGSYTVSLMKVNIDKAASERLAANIEETLKNSSSRGSSLGFAAVDSTVQKQLGMAGVAPLDQGVHGSCATFANTGAIDALYGLTDQSAQVSELCNLELGKSLVTLGEQDRSGWDGTLGPVVLTQINSHGYMTIDQESSGACGGLTSYPVTSSDTGGSISKDDFESYSKQNQEFKVSNWQPIFSASSFPVDPEQADQVLTEVKQAINSQHRVSFGTLLDDSIGQNGAVAKYSANNNTVNNNNTWVLTSKIASDAQANAIHSGHEMLITGYDDQQCVTYQDGLFGGTKQQCGLLTLRNSWGNTGDNGDYYMTYDHFKTMVMEAQEIK